MFAIFNPDHFTIWWDIWPVSPGVARKLSQAMSFPLDLESLPKLAELGSFGPNKSYSKVVHAGYPSMGCCEMNETWGKRSGKHEDQLQNGKYER